MRSCYESYRNVANRAWSQVIDIARVRSFDDPHRVDLGKDRAFLPFLGFWDRGKFHVLHLNAPNRDASVVPGHEGS